jgi:hypothetical protein
LIGLLQDILCVLEKMAAAIIGLLVVVVNAAIAAIAALLGLIVMLLPPIPDAPEIPDGGALGFINFFVPIGPDLAIAIALVGCFGLFMLFRVALNWVKAL